MDRRNPRSKAPYRRAEPIAPENKKAIATGLQVIPTAHAAIA